MTYYRDVDTGFIVRKPEDGMYLEYTYDNLTEWTQTEPDSSYEREYWLGEGRNCLFNITEKEAIAIISSRNNSLNKNQILSAQKCFIYSNNTIYIETDERNDMIIYNMKSKSWKKQEIDKFLESMNSAPHLFQQIGNEEAVEKIFGSVESSEDKTKSNDVNDTANKSIKQEKPTSDNIIDQMADGIVGKESNHPTKKEKEIRQQLTGRALEYLMFMDEDD